MLLTDLWWGSQQMHPLSAPTTIAPLDLDVMLKPLRTKMTMTVVNNGGEGKGEQITVLIKTEQINRKPR